MSGVALQQAEGAVLFTGAFAYGFWFLVRKFRRTRPELRIGVPILAAFVVRLVAIAVINDTPLATLRGGDESVFLAAARHLAAQPLGRGTLPHGPYQLHTVLFALQLKLGIVGNGTLRITQSAIALLGVLLLVVAVNDMAGARAARLTAWLLAFDPTGIFFQTALHKEANMELAAGMVVFGGTMLWRKLDVRGILLCILACAIAVATRNYAGWFLAAAAVMILLHASLRHTRTPMKALPALYAVLAIAVVAAPAILQESTTSKLKGLQYSQNANTLIDPQAAAEGGNNLALEAVDFSSRGAIVSNLPRRVLDVLTRPYPWQLGDASQEVGSLGTIVAYVVLLLLIVYAILSGRHALSRIGPFLYPFLFLLAAYSLSAGNAGTGFRYRSSIMPLALAALCVLRHHVRRERAPAPAPAVAEPAAEPSWQTGGLGPIAARTA